MVDPDLRALRSITDPVERARAATRRLDLLTVEMNELSRIRREAVEEMISNKLTHADIANVLGVSRGRVSQLTKSGPPPERAFFGSDRLTLAVAGKVEAGRPDVRPVVAQEDLFATEHLAELVRGLSLDAVSEVIPPGVEPDLTRENLVVICGPRHSSLLRQILKSDPRLAFEHDDAGWHLVDHSTSTTYRSPSDAGEPGDIGYLARLPRPDAAGTFVYIAGIHAAGAAGVVHYLSRHVADLYREVRHDARFSVLVSSEYDPTTHETTRSKLVTPIYRHDEA